MLTTTVLVLLFILMVGGLGVTLLRRYGQRRRPLFQEVRVHEVRVEGHRRRGD